MAPTDVLGVLETSGSAEHIEKEDEVLIGDDTEAGVEEEAATPSELEPSVARVKQMQKQKLAELREKQNLDLEKEKACADHPRTSSVYLLGDVLLVVCLDAGPLSVPTTADRDFSTFYGAYY